MIKAPNFWFKKITWWPILLCPFSLLYQLIHRINWWITKPMTTPTPVICVGNTGLGGAGKTPTALALGNILSSLGYKYHFLTRGYGGSEEGPLVVSCNKQNATLVGDEPLLLSKQAPTVMAKNRLKGLSFMEGQTLDAILMDDGYQNPDLKKLLNILVIDGKIGFGNGHVFPSGPLREPLAMSLGRASAVVVIGAPSNEVKNVLNTLQCPIFQATLSLDPPDGLIKEVIPFAGIAFPKKFFTSLRKEKFTLRNPHGFPDHHPYTPKEFEALKDLSQKLKVPLVTTEKDFMRLSKEQRKFVTPIPARLKWEKESTLKEFLKENLL